MKSFLPKENYVCTISRERVFSSRKVSSSMGSLHLIDLLTIAFYLLATLVIGLSFTRQERTGEEYFLAGRRLTWPIIGASLFSTNISAEHLVGLAGDAHRVGLAVGGFEWIASFCLLTLGLVFAPQYLRNKIYTIPEFLERRFSLAARIVLSGYFMVMIILTKISIALWAGALVLHALFGWDMRAVMWGIGISYGVIILVGFGAVLLVRAPGGGGIMVVGCLAVIAGLTLLVFGIMYLLMLEKFGKALKRQAELARQTWAAAAGAVT